MPRPTSGFSDLLRVLSTRYSLANFAWLSVLAALALSLLGAYAIDIGQDLRGPSMLAGGPTDGIVARQLVFIAVGVFAAFVILLPHYRLIGMVSWALMIAVIGLLVFLLLPFVPDWLVTPRNGTRGWINLGVADFQPAELAKIAFVLVAARYLRFRESHRTFLGLLPPAIIGFIPVALITLQPDLGSATLFLPSLFAMLVAAGAKLKHLTFVVLIAAMAAPLSYPLLRPHQKQRIVGLIKQLQGDTSSSHDINYQAYTAQTLLGAGGIAGLDEPKARALIHFNRLPERHNDMIYSVIVHRFGFLGGLLLLSLYLLWIGGAVLVAATTKDPFGRLICVGLAAFVATQVIINVGMNVGLVPIVGVTLPFVSYGGSSLLSVWLMTGLILNIALRRPRPPFRPSFEYADDNAF